MNSAERAGLRPKGNVPTLRFPEFSKEWCIRELQLLVPQISSGKDKPEEGTYTLYGSTGPMGKTSKASYNEEIVLVARVGANAGHLQIVNEPCGVTDNTLVLNGKDWNHYIYYYLQHYNLNKLVFGSGQPLITGGMLKKIRIFCGGQNERNKIVELLQRVDDRISTQIRIIEDLKSLSDVICERLYNPSEKGVWQTYKYADLFSVSNERNSKLQYKNVLSASQEYGMIERNELNIDIKFEESSITNYKIVRPNQYVIHLRSFQGGFAYSEKIGVCSPAYTILVPNEKLATAFLKYYFTSKKFIDSLRIVTYGIRDGRSISVEEFLQLKVIIPDFSQQNHIVRVMQLWEEKIRTEEAYLSELQRQKMYLLSTMFV